MFKVNNVTISEERINGGAFRIKHDAVDIYPTIFDVGNAYKNNLNRATTITSLSTYEAPDIIPTINTTVSTVTVGNSTVTYLLSPTSTTPDGVTTNLATTTVLIEQSLPSSLASQTLEYLTINNLVFQKSPYNPTSDDIITPGTFYYNPTNDSLVIRNYEDNIILSNTRFKIYTSSRIATTLLDNSISGYPEDLINYAIKGSINISYKFNDHPNMSLSLIANNKTIEALESYFNNTEQKIVVFGVAYRVRNFYLNIANVNHYTEGDIVVEAQLDGFYEKLIDDDVTLSDNNNFTNNNTLVTASVTKAQARTTSFGGNSINSNNNRRISLNSLATKQGFSITGSDLFTEVANELPSDTKINLLGAVRRELINDGKYGNFENEKGMDVRAWIDGGQAHRINDGDLTGRLSYRVDVEAVAEKIDNERFEAVLSEEISRDPKFLPPEDDFLEEDQVDREPKFETIKKRRETIINPPDGSSKVKPNDVVVLKTLDHNFDVSGEVKVEETKIIENGVVLTEIVRKYGFAYTADQILVNDGTMFTLSGVASSYWQQISETTKTYIYDEDSGYLVKEKLNGWQLARYKQEGEKFESRFGKSEEQFLYTFNRVPISGVTAYVLENYRDYFDDLNNSEQEFLFWEETGKDGRIKIRYKLNPLYVEPKFIRQKLEFYNSFAFTPNPKNDPVKPGKGRRPDYTTGEIRHSVVTNNILKSANTSQFATGLPNQLEDAGNSEDRYITYEQIHTAQDSSYANSLSETNVAINGGRPPEGLRRPILLRPKDTGDEDPKRKQTDQRNRTGIVSFTKQKEKEITNRENVLLQQQRTFANVQLSCQLYNFRPEYRTGDTIFIEYNNKTYECIINAIVHNLNIIDEQELVGRTQLTLGLKDSSVYTAPDELRLQTRVNSDDLTDDAPVEPPHLFKPYSKGQITGDLSEVEALQLSAFSRGNY